MENKNSHTNKESQSSAPPLFKKWNHWYMLVVGNLIFWIIALYLFSYLYGG